MKLHHTYLLLFALLLGCQTNKQPTESGPQSGVICGASATTDTAWYSSGKTAPLFDGLEGIDFPLSTQNSKAKQYFNQGLMLAFGFNHGEAARSFYQSAREDSSCAMCWWGYAYVLGPNYNMGMEPDNYQRAYVAAQKALSLSNTASPLEKDLIQALSFRYAADTSTERSVLDSAYSGAMRHVYARHSANPTVAAIFAESIMDLHPWDLWTKDGKPQPWTPEIVRVLEKALQNHETHPGLNHFYVHAMEQSPTPERALPSADRLRTLVPGSGHLTHMPSHIYIHTGQYHEGTLANLRAVLVDSAYTAACHAQGAYPLAYYPHNHHFIAACGALEGNSKHALYGARNMQHLVNKDLMHTPDWATLIHYYTLPWHVMVKFGLWDSIINEQPVDPKLLYASAIQKYALGMAHLAKGQTPLAKTRLDEIKILAADSSLIEMTIWGINKMTDILDIAALVLEGEIAAREKKYDHAIDLLKRACAIEDQLAYNEPPDWFLSVRHNLGAVQLEAGKQRDAIRSYEEDLKTYPENGWALQGLYQAQLKIGKISDAEKTKTRFETAWAHADVAINSSRIW